MIPPEVGLFARGGSVAEPLTKDIAPTPSKPSSLKAPNCVTSPVNGRL